MPIGSSRALPLCLLTSILLLPATLPQVQQPDRSEAFDDPTLPGRERTPFAIVADGHLRIEGDGFPLPPGEISIEGLILRLRFEGDGVLEVRHGVSGAGMYTLRLLPGEVHMRRGARGTQITLASTSSTLGIGERRILEIGLAGSEHRIFLGPGVEIHAVDEEPLTGGVMFHVFGEAAAPGRGYARILKELWSEGTPTGAHWNPTKVPSDTRLEAFASDRIPFTFRAPEGPATIEVALWFRRACKDVIDQKGWTDRVVLMEQEIMDVP